MARNSFSVRAWSGMFRFMAFRMATTLESQVDTLRVADELQLRADPLPRCLDVRMIRRFFVQVQLGELMFKALSDPVLDRIGQQLDQRSNLLRLQRMLGRGDRWPEVGAGRFQAGISCALTFPVQANCRFDEIAVDQHPGLRA